MNADDFVGGHSILALERFMDETRHMIIFDVLSWKSPVGEKGERLRLFLSDVGYHLHRELLLHRGESEAPRQELQQVAGRQKEALPPGANLRGY